MVEIVGIHRLSEFREGTENESFPRDELEEIRRAIESVPADVFLTSKARDEVKQFDTHIGQQLSNYHVEGSDECVLWAEEGFYHSVDLYDPANRIAIELEKSEKKYVWKDLAKFGRGAQTQAGGQAIIEFGCLVVPDYYSGSSVFSGTRKILEFMKPMLETDDIAIVGFHLPTSE